MRIVSSVSTSITAMSVLLVASTSSAFAPVAPLLSLSLSHDAATAAATTSTSLAVATRRDFGRGILTSATTALVSTLLIPSSRAFADDNGVLPAPPVEMKLFVDPQGLFVINVPAKFYKIRRQDKGDLPDEKTGKGRRGSSIFTAGDLSKAEIIAVERFPTKVLLEENGIEATGDLSTFPALGEPYAIANLINQRREKEKTTSTMILPDSVVLSPDKKEITFKLKTEIEVQKPELLMEQYGMRQLFRLTTAKATLNSNDGNIMAVFASALERDFQGRDGEVLEESMKSFRVTDRSDKV